MARQRLTADDYAAMAVAAAEMAERSVGVRKEMNKALQDRYRALATRKSAATGLQRETLETESV